LFVRYPGTTILNGNSDAGAAAGLKWMSMDADPSAPRAVFEGVADQIQQTLRKRAHIYPDLRQVRVDIFFHLKAACPDNDRRISQHLIDDVFHSEKFHITRAVIRLAGGELECLLHELG